MAKIKDTCETNKKGSSMSNKNLVGCAGEFFVCAELCRQGYVALPAYKNNPLYDIIAANEDGTKTVAIQVKTKANTQGWRFGEKIKEPKNNNNLFTVLVSLPEKGAPEFWIFPYDELSQRVTQLYDEDMKAPRKIKRKGKEMTDPKAEYAPVFDLKNFNAADKAKKGEWGPITKILD